MRFRAVAAVCAAALVACQGTGTPSPSSSPANPLAAADAKLLSGDYEGAEAAYQDLAKQGVPDTTAHYALLLDYEGRYREAVVQATAAVKDHEDSAALARLTRAYDWADDVPAAVDAGARAAKAEPVDPLAHVFYSEALADAGRFADAQRELRQAEQAKGSDPYLKSEIYREWANYYRDQGDDQSELNNLQLSLRAQPKFPERGFELARFQYVAKRVDLARQAISNAVNGSRSTALLTVAGDVAVIPLDFDTANQWYQAADKAAGPGSARAEVGLAEVAMISKHDSKAAHDQLVGALKKNPADSNAYEFLSHLDRYVLKTDPAADLKAVGPEPGDLAAARKAVVDTVNADRQRAGVPALKADTSLDTASEAHAWYVAFNFGADTLSGLGIHQESASLPGYTGAGPLARDRAAGFQGNRGSEVINHVFTPVAAIGVWIDSVYHRFPLLSPETQVAGYGEATLGPLSVSVMDLGLGPAASTPPVVYPAAGQTGVPVGFIGGEIPNPVPSGAQLPVGYPITVQTGNGSNLQVSSIKVTDPDGKDVAAYVLNPGKEVDTGEVAVLPQQPLKPATAYTVDVEGTLDSSALSKKWSFTTGG
ncbi:MAG TPA: CAP domain-containing protein [Candidatus Dormibacteraeota bacterium]